MDFEMSGTSDGPQETNGGINSAQSSPMTFRQHQQGRGQPVRPNAAYFDQTVSSTAINPRRRQVSRARGRGGGFRRHATTGGSGATTNHSDAPTENQTRRGVEPVAGANPFHTNSKSRNDRGNPILRKPTQPASQVAGRKTVRWNDQQSVQTSRPGFPRASYTASPLNPTVNSSGGVTAAQSPAAEPRGWNRAFGPVSGKTSSTLSIPSQPPKGPKSYLNRKKPLHSGRSEKGSQSAEADAFYLELERYRTAFAQHFRLPSPLPALDRSGKSTHDLLKAINETDQPYLEFSQLWTIFHQTREAHGLEGFVQYAQLANLIEPIAAAVQAEKARARGEQGYGAVQAYGHFSQLGQPHLSLTEPAQSVNFEDNPTVNRTYSRTSEQATSQSQPLTTMEARTATIDQFLIDVRGLVRQQNAAALAEYVIIEPPLPPPYRLLIRELKQHFPKGSESALDEKCETQLNLSLDEEQWPAFARFLGQYFSFMRDLDPSDLLATFMGLNGLIQSGNTAFGHPTHGVLLVPTILAYSRVLARLAIGLEKHPELIYVASGSAEDGEGITLPERAANTIREALITCIRDRSPGPEGKWLATIKLANVCLKILFQSGRVERSTLIFQNMNTTNQFHPLSQFHRADRVTFHYYAGKASFLVGQYYNASKLLEKAYLECHSQSIKQRRLIVIPLVVSNILHGRFPSEYIYRRDEADGLRENVGPICRAIKLGDLESFRRLTSFDSPSGQWLLRHKVLVQIREGCEMLVYRSLLRRIFLLAGTPAKQSDQGRVLAGSLELSIALHVIRHLEKRALSPERINDGGPGNRNLNWIFMDEADAIPPNLKNQLVAAEFEGLIDPATGRDLYLSPPPSLLENRLPTIDTIEATVATLIDQGFLNGYVHRATKRFALQAGRGRGAGVPNQSETAIAAFPNVWEVVKKANTSKSMSNGVIGPGQVIRMTGARPAGM